MNTKENKKVKNATPTFYDNIHFKSRLEVTVYKTLKDVGVEPAYESYTISLSESIRPSVPFYTGKNGVFKLDSKPVGKITYTPDFTFNKNGIFVIIEVKGRYNDVYPVKKNLVRKKLEEMQNCPVMFFEVKSKTEILKALKLIDMETPTIQKIRKLIPELPEKDIPIATKLLEKRDWDEFYNLINSAIIKVEKSKEKEDTKYDDIDLDSLYKLLTLIPQEVLTFD